ncbi:hypothetical protein QUV83_10185 [Cellulomonas cellasea]|nr:hypothetical protein [Cellulomonas cellasea]
MTVDAKIPRDVRIVLGGLRERMYHPGVGTWYTAAVTVYADGRIETNFDYDNEPAYPFAPLSWAADAERYPRAAEMTPGWLTAKAEHPAWAGLRMQVDFTAGGEPISAGAHVDATTTAQGHEWSHAIANRLRAAGHAVREATSEGEDGQGNPAAYDEVLVDVGGYLSLAFFRDMIFWWVDVAPDQADSEIVTRAVRDVARTVQEVSGWALCSGQLNSYERRVLGLGA